MNNRYKVIEVEKITIYGVLDTKNKRWVTPGNADKEAQEYVAKLLNKK